MKEEKTTEKEVEKEEPQEKEKAEFTLVQVPTQHTLAVQTPKGEVISTEQLMVDMANDLKEVKKGIVG